ncbi:hypothetical protein OG729_38510 [Streptomyces sp. NBC_00210]|uniref:hypothetical protein n=1 Tax=unclassified Streptomyces TaxID=2593676 RepID=UPI003245A609
MTFGNTARKTALAATAALAMTGICASTSMAAEAMGATAVIRTSRSAAYWYHGTNTLHVGDYKADGIGARAYLTWGGNKVSVYANGENKGQDKHLSIREGTTVWLQLCYTREGKNYQCSATKKGVA